MNRNFSLNVKGWSLHISFAKYTSQTHPSRNRHSQNFKSNGRGSGDFNRNSSEVIPNVIAHEVEDVKQMLQLAKVGTIVDSKTIEEIYGDFDSYDLANIQVCKIGFGEFLVTKKLPDSTISSISESELILLQKIFSKVRNWNDNFKPKVAKVFEIYGIPLQCWDQENITKIARVLGEVIQIQQYDDTFESVQVRVAVSVDQTAISTISIKSNNYEFKVMVQEVCPCSMDLDELLSEESSGKVLEDGKSDAECSVKNSEEQEVGISGGRNSGEEDQPSPSLIQIQNSKIQNNEAERAIVLSQNKDPGEEESPVSLSAINIETDEQAHGSRELDGVTIGNLENHNSHTATSPIPPFNEPEFWKPNWCAPKDFSALINEDISCDVSSIRWAQPIIPLGNPSPLQTPIPKKKGRPPKLSSKLLSQNLNITLLNPEGDDTTHEGQGVQYIGLDIINDQDVVRTLELSSLNSCELSTARLSEDENFPANPLSKSKACSSSTKRGRGRPPKNSVNSIDKEAIGTTANSEFDEAFQTWELGKLLGMTTNNEEEVLLALRRSQRKKSEAAH